MIPEAIAVVPEVAEKSSVQLLSPSAVICRLGETTQHVKPEPPNDGMRNARSACFFFFLPEIGFAFQTVIQKESFSFLLTAILKRKLIRQRNNLKIVAAVAKAALFILQELSLVPGRNEIR